VCNDLPKGIPIILAGDFNAELSSPELNLLEDAGYLAATDRCSKQDKEAGTHRTKNIFIDHFFYASDTRVSFNACSLADLGEDVSDHNPVMFSFSVPVK
jgi:endonuclease/exonuclease/phosphatase family metal-dependent hydrolase